MNEHPYQKIGGWLRFFQVNLVLTLISIPIMLINDFIAFTGFELAYQLLGTLLMSISLLPIIQLLKRNPKFLWSYHVTTFVSLAWSIAQIGRGLYIWTSETGLDDNQLVASVPALVISMIAFVFGVGFFILWRMYYTRSVRVRTYMGTDAYITQCSFTKNAVPPQPAVPDVNDELDKRDAI